MAWKVLTQCVYSFIISVNLTFSSVQKYSPIFEDDIPEMLQVNLVTMQIVFLFPECQIIMEREVFIIVGLFCGTIYNLL